MNLPKNILLLVNELQYTCGLTSSVYNLLSVPEIKQNCNISILCGGGDAVQEFEKMGYNVIINENILHQKRSLLRYAIAHFQIYKVIKELKIGIVHSHHFYASSIAWNISRLIKINTILTIHGLIPEVGKINHYKAHLIVAVNQHIYDFIVNNKIRSSEDVALIRNCLKKLENKPNRIGEEKLRFLAASRIEYYKGLDTYVEAISLLPDKYLKKAEFMLAGRGSFLPEILNLIKQKGNLVNYLGNLKNLTSLLPEYNVFVMPSRSKAEGFPMNIIEAAYAGNLIITSKFRGSDAVIDEKHDAIVFENDQPLDLAHKIMDVIDNYELYRSVADKFREKVEIMFDPSLNSKSLVKLYNSLFCQ